VLDTMPPFRRVELHRKALALLLVEDIDDDQLALVLSTPSAPATTRPC